MNGTMKALVYHGPNQISLDNVPLPQIINKDDMIIKVTLSAICTSDVHIAAGHLPYIKPGQILGHEFCGEIVDMGSEVRGYKVGDKVMVDPESHCGSCSNCLNGLKGRFCTTDGHGIFGVRGPYGCQADYMWLPNAPHYTRPIPEGLTEEDVILVPDMLATGWFGVTKARVAAGDTVVVIGCGPVGLSTCLTARLLNAKRIIAVDILDYPLEAALKAGAADYVINASREDVISRIAEITGGKMADAVIETAGTNETFNMALNAAGVYGRVCTVAIFSAPLTIPTMHMSAVMKNLEITMGIQGGEGQEIMLDAIKAGKLNPQFMLTHKAPLNDIMHGYDIFSSKKDNCIKWLVTPNER